MPNIKSAKKRVLVNAKKAARNKAIKTNLKTTIKNAKLAIENKAQDSENLLKLAIQKIDKAVAKGILHKNTANRKKSKLTLQLNRKK